MQYVKEHVKKYQDVYVSFSSTLCFTVSFIISLYQLTKLPWRSCRPSSLAPSGSEQIQNIVARCESNERQKARIRGVGKGGVLFCFAFYGIGKPTLDSERKNLQLESY